jgi:hypothetical protein
MLWYFWRYIYSSPINVFFYKCIFNINLLDVVKRNAKNVVYEYFFTHYISRTVSDVAQVCEKLKKFVHCQNRLQF